MARIIGVEIPGEKRIDVALRYIYGIGPSNATVILDARPAREYEAGPIAGAISIPVDELQQRLRQLLRDKDYVAYCRGPYCVYADRAVEVLVRSGRRARRLVEGFPEWRAAGLPVARGAAATAAMPRQPRRRRRATPRVARRSS